MLWIVKAMETDVGLGVDDVYYLAAEIGKEFEKIIDLYGPEAVKSLMPKVIHALEHLESNALRNEHIEAEIADLKGRISQLEYDKLEKAEFRSKFEQELEQIEDTWRKETSYLNELVTRLREENNRLSSSLAEKESYSSKTCRGCISEKEIQMIQKLQERVNKERERLHVMERKLQEKSMDMDNLQEQVDTLGQMNRDLRWKQKHLQTQTRILVEEKADLQAQLQAQQRELQMIRQHLGQAVKENFDLSTAQTPNLRGKLIFDADDPLRPRFTLEELRNILFERNTLKERVSALEDELALYKPKEMPQSERGVEAASAADEDLPVQGPINREPDEKLYPGKKGSSGILKFFPSITWPRLKLQ